MGRAVVEHVIGFHEVLVLRPLAVRVERPRHDVPERWRATHDALFTVLADEYSLSRPLRSQPDADTYELGTLLPALSIDVLVHTWDLARAIELEVRLDPQLVERAYEFAVHLSDARAARFL